MRGFHHGAGFGRRECLADLNDGQTYQVQNAGDQPAFLCEAKVRADCEPGTRLTLPPKNWPPLTLPKRGGYRWYCWGSNGGSVVVIP